VILFLGWLKAILRDLHFILQTDCVHSESWRSVRVRFFFQGA